MPSTAYRSGFRLVAGPLADALAAEASVASRAAEGLFRKDASTWTADPAVQAKIANRLGWLSSPALMASEVDRLTTFAAQVRRDGFTDVVLLGMGGSSLAPEVMRAVLGIADGSPRLHMLDSTDPAAVLAIRTNPHTTLYLLASKSGTTIEPNSLAAHFIRVLQDAGVARWADHFVAITDPGTALATRAKAEGFRETFINPADIGGRFSALSFFGLVPTALMGQDVASLVREGLAMLDEAEASAADPINNPAVGLGLLMGAGAKAGRDKLTLVVPPSLEAFGLWVEQLVAESTGKQGVGVVPIAGEALGAPGSYGSDRAFVRLRPFNAPDEAARDTAFAALTGAPTLTLDFPAPASLGAEFMRWEIATAVAGVILGVNPFDEPNVQTAKDATNSLLATHKAEGRLPVAAPDRTLANGVTLTLSRAARAALGSGAPESLLSLVSGGDYVGILAYLGPDASLAAALDRFRSGVRTRTGAATMFGYGPRYLHSTGQLHKGGANNGVFVLISDTPAQDVDIPGQPFSFGTLELAQALGDFNSLDATGRRALHVHLPRPDAALLETALEALLQG
ncbi:MAG: glucose-6-phosphate isomerase [Acidobacteria bacterium]|nr:glucose-6-phosphate isomerase [Acidobacteriota bacterium]